MPIESIASKKRRKWSRLKRTIFSLSPQLAELFQIKFEINSPDRHFLEREVFTYINEKFGSNFSVMFVGMDRYNWHYPRLLRGRFFSIDLDPKKRRYGHKNHHTTGSVTQLSLFHQRDKFDVVICNGLIGYGVNDLKTFDDMLRECNLTLKKDGLFFVGFNNTPKFLSFDIEKATNWRQYKTFIPNIPGVTSHVHTVETSHCHTFLFYKKA